jgi:hypothetical protein
MVDSVGVGFGDKLADCGIAVGGNGCYLSLSPGIATGRDNVCCTERNRTGFVGHGWLTLYDIRQMPSRFSFYRSIAQSIDLSQHNRSSCCDLRSENLTGAHMISSSSG